MAASRLRHRAATLTAGACTAAFPQYKPAQSTHNDMTEMKELLVTAKPAGKVPLKRLDAICGSGRRQARIRAAGCLTAAARGCSCRPARCPVEGLLLNRRWLTTAAPLLLPAATAMHGNAGRSAALTCRSARFRNAGPTAQLSGMFPVSWFWFTFSSSSSGKPPGSPHSGGSGPYSCGRGRAEQGRRAGCWARRRWHRPPRT